MWQFLMMVQKQRNVYKLMCKGASDAAIIKATMQVRLPKITMLDQEFTSHNSYFRGY
ncbi:hypothetical protein O9993_23340 [Vibrio lentus]|nr:hypothetical protein [Vibrio lentus]